MDDHSVSERCTLYHHQEVECGQSEVVTTQQHVRSKICDGVHNESGLHSENMCKGVKIFNLFWGETPCNPPPHLKQQRGKAKQLVQFLRKIYGIQSHNFLVHVCVRVYIIHGRGCDEAAILMVLMRLSMATLTLCSMSFTRLLRGCKWSKPYLGREGGDG